MVAETKVALDTGHAVIIGLQTTGEVRYVHFSVCVCVHMLVQRIQECLSKVLNQMLFLAYNYQSLIRPFTCPTCWGKHMDRHDS